MSDKQQINQALDKALGKPVAKKATKKVKTTNEVVAIEAKTLIVEDGRQLLM